MSEKRRPILKHLLLFTVINGVILLLTGCWDRLEVNDMAIVTAAAIDKKDDNQIELSVQVFIPKSASMGSVPGGGASGGVKTSLVASQSGVNMADALSKVQAELPRKVFWGHCKVFIFGEEAAKDGVQGHLDFLLRHPQPRERAYMFVSEGTARKLLEVQTKLERDTAEGIRELSELRIGLLVTMQKLNEMVTSDNQSAALPFLKIMTKKEHEEPFRFAKIVGSAVFKKDRMIAKVPMKQTRGILWLRNEIKGYTVTVRPKNEQGDLSLNPVKAHVDLNPHIHNNEWTMNVNIRTEGTVVQNNTELNLSEQKNLAIVEDAFRHDIKQRIESTIEKIQQEMKTDIFGFGKEFHRKYPSEWKKIKKPWDDKFPEVKVNIHVKAHILREGYITEPTRVRVQEGNKQ